jgi:two-component system, OmpR family, response regulator
MQETWDIVILDISLPGKNGFEIITEMRASGVETPVIFLTARDEVKDRIEGFSKGADDYLTKPFSMEELKARIFAVSRRYQPSKSAEHNLPEGWSLDSLLREVKIGSTRVPLQPREWSLLKLFLSHEGEVLSNPFLLDHAWGIHFDPGTNVVNAAISRLRKKLDNPQGPSHFETLRGRGHTFRSHV